MADGPEPPAGARAEFTGWHTIGEAARLVSTPKMIRRTFITALVVGTLLSAINQGYVLWTGDADVATWVRIAANYCIPFVVSNVGVLSARHQ